MMKGFEEFQKVGKDGFDATVRSFGEVNKGFQAIAAEITDYSKKAFEDSTALFEKLFGVKSFEKAIEVQTEYAKAPEVTRQRMYLETMQQVFSNTSKVMVDAKGQGNLLYLPLDKLMQGAGAVAAAPAAADPVTAPQTAARTAAPTSNESPPQLDNSLSNQSRVREPSLRSRDREAR